MALLDTFKLLLGNAWHVNSDVALAALLPSVDGTAEASKVLVLDANKDATGIRNLTATGAVIAPLTPAAGTAAVAPQTFTAGTNLTTPAAGAVEFDGTTFFDTAVANARQVRDDEQYCILTSNYSALDSSAAQKAFNASTNGAITLTAGVKYAFEEVIYLTNTGTTSHTWSVLFGGTASFTRIAYWAAAYTATANALTALSSIFAAVATAIGVTAASVSATENVQIILRGVMDINAGGTVIPQIKASAQPGLSGTPGVTVLAGSYFRIWPLGLAATATVGNWS